MATRSFICPKDPKKVAEFILRIYKKRTTRGGIVRATAGELSGFVYNEIADDIIDIIKKKCLDVRYLVGPVFLTKNKKNTMLERVIEGAPIKLYISPTRQFRHFLLTDDKYAAVQEPHNSLPNSRMGNIYTDKDSLDYSTISSLINYFDNFIKGFGLEPVKQKSDNLIVLSKSKLKKVEAKAISDSEFFDLLPVNRIREYAKTA